MLEGTAVLQRPRRSGLPPFGDCLCDLCGAPVELREACATVVWRARIQVAVQGTYHQGCCKAARARAEVVFAVTDFLVESAT